MALAMAAGFAAAGVLASAALAAEAGDPRPNVVVILVDDAAFMDFGIYGGEARTPNIDSLAASGAMFTGHYTSPLCSPSRAMLLTGLDNHLTGVATIPEVLPEEHVGQPGYSMRLEPGVLTLGDRLRALGYRTLMTGKWHLGDGPGDLPDSHGFDRSFALDASGADNWADKSYMPFYAEAPWYEDGAPADRPGGVYSSTFIIDRMIDYLATTAASRQARAPFFAYLAFQAIHIPVQAPPNLTASYDGVYDGGWDAVREARWGRAKELGFVPPGAALADMPASMRRWEDLSDRDRRAYAARMQVNAAMLEAMDREIGRFIARLKAEGEFDDTIFVVTSDNGPEPSRGDDDPRLAVWMALNGYHTNLEGVGEPGSWGFIGPEWAMAAASPHDMFKFLGSEGGVRAPLIIAGPGVGGGRTITARTIVSDIAPTILDLIGAPAPADAFTGRSLAPLLAGAADAVYGPEEALGIEVSGNAAILKGRWKITRNQRPHGDGRWRLYDIVSDPGETADLSAASPAVFDDMLSEYDQYSRRVGVLEVPAGYDSEAELARNTFDRMGKTYGPKALLAAAGAIVLLLMLALIRRARRREGRGSHGGGR
ncbi:MAG: sulfatase-like hydrolase/transferase [Alphaproteobacteria bacterium]|nr:sulfatase-like hydrolase/transferase [Alphaproteobacteria bacterium]